MVGAEGSVQDLGMLLKKTVKYRTGLFLSLFYCGEKKNILKMCVATRIMPPPAIPDPLHA